jgi:hypothetical protein
MPKSGYSWKYPEKDKFGLRELLGLLETGFGVYKDLQGMSLAKQQLAQQTAADRQRLIDEAEAEAQGGYEADVVKALESGFQRREPRMPNLDPDEAAALAAKGMLPRGSVSKPTLEYEPGKRFLSLLTSGDLQRAAPEPMPDFGPGVTAWREGGKIQTHNQPSYVQPQGPPAPMSEGERARLIAGGKGNVFPFEGAGGAQGPEPIRIGGGLAATFPTEAPGAQAPPTPAAVNAARQAAEFWAERNVPTNFRGQQAWTPELSAKADSVYADVLKQMGQTPEVASEADTTSPNIEAVVTGAMRLAGLPVDERSFMVLVRAFQEGGYPLLQQAIDTAKPKR